MASGELPPLPLWASEAVDLINDLPPAADLAATPAQAEDALGRIRLADGAPADRGPAELAIGR